MEDIQTIRGKFKKYLYDNDIKSADTFYSDADYPRKSYIGIDYWDIFKDSDSIKKAFELLEKHFIEKGRKLSGLASYQRGLRLFKDFLDTTYGGVAKIMNNEQIKYYWVCQGTTYKEEKENGIIKAPLDNFHHHFRLKELKPGDKIIHYSKTAIRAISTVQNEPKEILLNTQDWLEVEVEYQELSSPIPHESFVDILRNNSNLLPTDYSPFNKTFGLNQGYLFKFNRELFDLIINKKSVNYWTYSPGKNAANWEDFYNQNIMAIGWDQLGNLKEYETKQDIVEKFRAINATTHSFKNDASACWDFANDMNVGDIIYAKKGNYEIIGRGIVTSDYSFDDTRNEYCNVRNVEWTHKGTWNRKDLVEGDFAAKTLTKITPWPKLYNELERLILKENNMSNTNNTNNKTAIQPLNQILYGPPGTGKTYNTALKAVEILEPQTDVKSISRQELMDKYEEYRKNNQIKFVTFHQSYAYEEFVEGIRPDLSNDDCGLRYILHKGIFKEIAELAKSEYAKANVKSDIDFSKTNFFKMSLGYIFSKEDADIYDYCIKKGVVALGYGQDADFTNAHNVKDLENIINSNEKFKEESSFVITALNRFKFKMQKGDIVLVPNGNKNVRAIGIIESNYFFDSDTEIRYSQFRKVKWIYEGADIPVDKILNNKNLSQQTIYEFDNFDINKEFLGQFFSGNESPEKKNYVLIIDEINRGEISKVFGELITLIEKSKRTNDEKVEVKLPYSGQLFSLPPNLFIVGTMNTADRSIALLDIALRRRFDFIPMYPDSSVIGTDGCAIEVDGINLAELLDQMNERIGALMDDDHKIGHSYLMGIKGYDDLNYAFKNRILPLLQEYFYNNYEKIAKVLNQDEDYEGEDNWNNTEDTIIHKKMVLDNIPKYFINENFTKEALIKVYQ